MTELNASQSIITYEDSKAGALPGDLLRGWILYDAGCRSCTASAKFFANIFRRRGFHLLPLQTPWVQARLGLQPGVLEEMHVLTKDGEDFGGANAVIFLARKIWWAWAFYGLARFPGMHTIIDRAYRWIAAHRGCNHFACERRRPKEWPAWAPLIVLPIVALLLRDRVAPWQFMWLMAGAIFLGCKWLTFWRALRTETDLHIERIPGYFIFWPGMDAASFLTSNTIRGDLPRHSRRIVFGVLKILCGAFALFALARLTPNPIVAGWIGMLGLILILHFGVFDLAAIAWRIAGVDAKPIMNAPIKATSPSEFWGRRWNGAFNDLVADVFFRPLAHSGGTVVATLVVFLFSGGLHELVISIPARGGYGLPTAYFLLQGLGVLAQRRFGLCKGTRGWLFTMFIAAAPAFWLFHPPFITRVVLPFLKSMHAL